MTLLDWKNFSKIKTNEYLRKSWTKNKNNRIDKLIENFNKVNFYNKYLSNFY